MKNRMVWTLMCVALLLSVTTHVYGQTDQTVAYLLFEDQENYYIRQTTSDSSNIQDVLIMPRASGIQFSAVVPETEIAELRNYIQVIHEPATLADLFLQSNLERRVSSITVAPDNRTIAINSILQSCVTAYRRRCFGINELSIFVPNTNTAPTPVFSTGFRSTEWFQPALSVIDVRIQEVMWLPDQQGVVISFMNDNIMRSQSSSPIVVIPVQGSPFYAASGIQMTLGANEREILTITRDTHDTLNVVTLDIAQRTATQVSYVLPYIIDQRRRITLLKGAIVFELADVGAASLNGLTAFNIADQTSYEIVSVDISRLDSTSDGSVAVAQTADGNLWRIELTPEALTLHPLTTAPVGAWDLNAQGQIVAINVAAAAIQVFDVQGLVQTESIPISQQALEGTIPAQLIEPQLVQVSW